VKRKIRIHPLLTFLIILFLTFFTQAAFPNLKFDLGYNMISSGVIIFLGLIIALSGIYSIKTTGNTLDPNSPEKASSLIDAGIFNYTRNPMYLGWVLVLIGVAIFFANIISLISALLYIPIMTQLQIKTEEKELSGIFGEEYIMYSKKVRRWL